MKKNWLEKSMRGSNIQSELCMPPFKIIKDENNSEIRC